MNDEKFVGKKISMDSSEYRILGIYSELVTVCDANSSKLDIFYVSINDLLAKIRNSEVLILEEKEIVIDYGLLPKTEKDKVDIQIEFLNKIVDYYGPSYSGLIGKASKPYLEQLKKTYNISTPTAFRLIRKYLQSGFNPISIVNVKYTKEKEGKKEYNYEKRTGKSSISLVIVDDNVRKQFEEALNKYKQGREKTLKYAYQGLIEKYYTYPSEDGNLPKKKPLSECPTYDQFYYYSKTHITKEEKDVIKTSAAEQRNAKRLLLGSSRTDAIRPGWIVEADAVEADFSIVSSINPEQAIGRPIIYVMTDVYSSAIVAISVAFDNNSYIGLTNLMLNLCDDKHAYSEKFGILIPQEVWPSNFIPHEIRCDRGSDFKSDKFTEVCRRLGINRTLETGATGSMKGIVEQSFHQFQSQLRPEMENKGLITKRFDSAHHREATLTMDVFTKLVINFVVFHNQKAINDYPMTKDMIANGVIPTPVNLWKYGCEKFGGPRLITDTMKAQYVFDLMIEAKASISRKGIKLNGLFYISSERTLLSNLYSLSTKRKTMDIRYDPRDVGRIFYVVNGKIHAALLNEEIPGNADYKGMNWEQYKEYEKERKDIRSKGKIINAEADFGLYQLNKVIIDASTSNNLANDTDIRPARKEEKILSNKQNLLADRIPVNNNDPLCIAEDVAVKSKKTQTIPQAKNASSDQSEIVIKKQPINKNEEFEEDPFGGDDDIVTALKKFKRNRR